MDHSKWIFCFQKVDNFQKMDNLSFRNEHELNARLHDPFEPHLSLRSLWPQYKGLGSYTTWISSQSRILIYIKYASQSHENYSNPHRIAYYIIKK